MCWALQGNMQLSDPDVVLPVQLVTQCRVMNRPNLLPLRRRKKIQTKPDISLVFCVFFFLMMAVGSCSKVWAVTVPEEMAAYR